MVRKRIFTEEDLKRLPALPDGCRWVLFSEEPCISANDDPNMAWVTASPYAVDDYCWDYYPRYGGIIRHREPVPFDTAINAITNLVWLNHISTP